MKIQFTKYAAGDENGIVLIIALLLLLALTLIGLNSVSTSSFDNIISGNQRLANAAFYASEAGIQVGLNQIPQTTGISRSMIGEDTYYSGQVTFRGYASGSGHDQTWLFKRYQVDATGDSFGASRRIEVQVRFGPVPAGTGYNNN